MRWGLLAAVVGCAGMLVGACRAPTQITLEVVPGVNITCNDIHSVAIAVRGTSADAEAQAAGSIFNAKTGGCTHGASIGTLVVVPASGNDVAVVVIAALGSKRDAESCRPGNYDSCIIARRRLSFVDHASLALPIAIDADCIGRACSELTTCRRGACVDATVACDGDNCGLGDEIGPTGTVDASFDAPTSTEAGMNDAATDSGLDGTVPPDGSTSNVFCKADHVLSCTVDNASCGAPNLCCRDSSGLAVCVAGACDATRRPACCSQSECNNTNETCTFFVGMDQPPNVGTCNPSD